MRSFSMLIIFVIGLCTVSLPSWAAEELMNDFPDLPDSLHLHIMLAEPDAKTRNFINKVTFSSKPLTMVEKLSLIGESFTFTRNGRTYNREIRSLADADRFDRLRQAVARSKNGSTRGVHRKFRSKKAHSSGRGGKNGGGKTLGGFFGTLIIGTGISLLSTDANAESANESIKSELVEDLFEANKTEPQIAQ